MVSFPGCHLQFTDLFRHVKAISDKKSKKKKKLHSVINIPMIIICYYYHLLRISDFQTVIKKVNYKVVYAPLN